MNTNEIYRRAYFKLEIAHDNNSIFYICIYACIYIYCVCLWETILLFAFFDSSVHTYITAVVAVAADNQSTHFIYTKHRDVVIILKE